MNAALWITQIILGGFFIFAGSLQVFKPPIAFNIFPWIKDFRSRFISNIGVLEILAGVGLIVPMVVHIGVLLTPLSAIGLISIMTLACYTHVKRLEYEAAHFPILLIFFLLVIVVGRW